MLEVAAAEADRAVQRRVTAALGELAGFYNILTLQLVHHLLIQLQLEQDLHPLQEIPVTQETHNLEL